MDRDAPIEVLDSGAGGLTVAREIMRQVLEERLVCSGDTARLPYRSKSQEAVIHFSRQILRSLESRGVKVIIVACNTASAYALETVEKEADIPVIGVVSAGARITVNATCNGKIGVIGTEGTIDSGIYTEVTRKMKLDIEVTGKPCPLLVPLVEEGLPHDSVTDEIVFKYLSALKGRYTDILVFGCTHYPLFCSTLGRLMGSKTTLVNPAHETAIELKQPLKERQMDCIPQDAAGEKYQPYVSDLAEKLTVFVTSILPGEVKGTKKINIEEYQE